jgi:hypothetical protein
MDGLTSPMAPVGTFSGSKSMRENYSEGGVETYYKTKGSSYQNPHYPSICKATSLIMDEYLELIGAEAEDEQKLHAKVLDLACGSGEATLAISEWLQHGTRRRSKQSAPAPPPKSRLDLTFSACDPFTHKAYRERTGLECKQWSFEDLSNGAADEDRYHLVISSYALHVASSSTLFTCLLQLSFTCTHLIILSPHKKPEPSLVERGGHWQLVKSLVEDRVHAWLYQSRGVQGDVREELARMLKGQSTSDGVRGEMG